MGYKHLFFDLDHTLWDYDKNAKETLEELYLELDIGKLSGFTKQHFVESFFIVNDRLWLWHDEGKINKAFIRKYRFHEVFKSIEYENQELSQTINRKYVNQCPQKTNVIENAIEVLQYVSPTYKIHIITNGFKETQYIKLIGSGLIDYVDEVIISENVGMKKPDPGIYEYGMSKAKATKNESIMIGDNLKTDIQGAINCGIDQVYFNPKQIRHNYEVTFEINKLDELMKIL